MTQPHLCFAFFHILINFTFILQDVSLRCECTDKCFDFLLKEREKQKRKRKKKARQFDFLTWNKIVF